MKTKVFLSRREDGKKRRVRQKLAPSLTSSLCVSTPGINKTHVKLFKVLGRSAGLKIITTVANITHLEDRANLE